MYIYMHTTKDNNDKDKRLYISAKEKNRKIECIIINLRLLKIENMIEVL